MSCEKQGVNYVAGNCVWVASEDRGGYYSTDLSLIIPEEDLNDSTAIKTLIKAGKLFALPSFVEAVEVNVTGAQTATNNYNITEVTSSRVSCNNVYGVKLSTFNFRKLQSLSGVQVSYFPINGNGEVGYTKVEDGDGTFSAKGQIAMLSLEQSLPMKADANTALKIPLRIICDRLQINEFAAVSEQNGIMDLKATASGTTSLITLTLLKENSTIGLGGLLIGDFDITDSLGASHVATTFTDLGNGVYTFAYSPALTAGVFNVAPSTTTIEVVGATQLYTFASVKVTLA